MPRRHFDDLPEAARKAVETQAGHIKAARTAPGGINSGIAVLLDTEGGTVFVKGIPADHPQAASQRREVAVSPHLPAACPRLLWHVEAGNWVLLGYEALHGTHADYTDSKDLVLVLDALRELQDVTVPATVLLKRAEHRWSAYADQGTADLFKGDALLHTDFAPDNVLIDERAHIIDWAWPTFGAPFIDPYVLAVRLMEAGHTPGAAITWVSRLPSWRQARAQAIDAFAVAVMRMWREIAHQDPQPWKETMASKAAELRSFLLTNPWTTHRP
jgi:hypothetical protein